MAAQATDRSSSEEEEIDDTYSLCGSDFEYEGKAGYTCEPEYSKEDLAQTFLFVDRLLIFFTYSFSVLKLGSHLALTRALKEIAHIGNDSRYFQF